MSKRLLRRKKVRNNMRYIVPIILLLTSLCGCASFKEDVGNYVKEAVVKSVETSIDEKLSARGLSVNEIKAAVDANRDGKISSTEVYSTIKETAKDAAVIEAKKLVDDKIAQLQSQAVTKSDLDHQGRSHWNSLLISLLGLLSAYLGKQIRDTKLDTHRDNRIAMLEKLLQKDLDGDGQIGDAAAGNKA